MDLEQAKAELLNAQAAYIDAWNRAISERKPELITSFVSKDFFGTFAAGSITRPETMDYQAYISGLSHAAMSLPAEARWVPEIHHVGMRRPTEGIILYRSVITGPGGGPELVQEVWRKEEEGWRILRCYEEVL